MVRRGQSLLTNRPVVNLILGMGVPGFNAGASKAGINNK